MGEDFIPQRRKIDITKNGINDIDYHNNFCNENEENASDIPNVSTDTPNISTYTNNNPPAVIDKEVLVAWPNYYNDMAELKQCLDYIDAHPEWRSKVGNEMHVNYWEGYLNKTKELYSRFSNIKFTDIGKAAQCSYGRKLIDELNILIDVIDGVRKNDRKKFINQAEITKRRKMFFMILLVFFFLLIVIDGALKAIALFLILFPLLIIAYLILGII